MSNKNCLILLCAVLAGACAEKVSGPNWVVPPDSIRNLTTAESQVSSATNAFAFNLLKQVNTAETSKPNFMISPLSASMALGMVLNGAAGSTFDAIHSTLTLGTLSQSEANAAYAGLIRQLYARAGTKVQFSLANSVWYDQQFVFLPSFADTLKYYFNAEVQSLDFRSATAPATISKWAEDKTNGRIKNLITAISPLEVMFLVNAVYFKAPWTNQFDPKRTANRPFTLANGSTVSAPTMSQEGSFRTINNGQVIAVELPYADSAYSMVVWMPGPGMSPVNGTDFTPASFATLLKAMQQGRILLELPKVRIEYDIQLNDVLSALGMGIAFTTSADFSKIDGKHDLFITRVFQKTFLDVNESGTEAAAATAVGVGVVSLPPTISFNRPFFYAIVEKASGTVLFEGRVSDPTK